MWRTIRVIAGVLLIGLGLVGLLVPALPGVPLLLAGGVSWGPITRG